MASELAGAPFADEALLAQAADLRAIAEKLEAETFDASDAKYLAQQAYNAHRGKGMYEAKLRRQPRPGPASPP